MEYINYNFRDGYDAGTSVETVIEDYHGDKARENALFWQKQYGIRTDEEIDCFNAYIESEKIDMAFGNTDWNVLYRKIVGDKVSDYTKEKMDEYLE